MSNSLGVCQVRMRGVLSVAGARSAVGVLVAAVCIAAARAVLARMRLFVGEAFFGFFTVKANSYCVIRFVF